MTRLTTPPRTLQEFLSLSRWDEPMMRDRLQQRIARRHHHEQAVGIIDETSFLKKGDKTACVQRQHCGAAGKMDNCVVSVHLGYATPEGRASGGFHTLLDGELYLSEKTWHQDRARCAEAAIPDEVVYRTKHEIALAQYRRALANGVRFAGYGPLRGAQVRLDQSAPAAQLRQSPVPRRVPADACHRERFRGAGEKGADTQPDRHGPEAPWSPFGSLAAGAPGGEPKRSARNWP